MQATKIDPEILKRLDALAEKLGVSSQFIWQILLRQAKVLLIEDILIVLAAIACTTAMAWFTWRITRLESKRHATDVLDKLFDRGLGAFVGYIAGWGITVASVVGAAVCIYEIPQLIFNPQFYALQQILSALRGR